MKYVIDRRHPTQIDIVRQLRVDAQQPSALSALCLGIEVGDLAAGMHAGIRATGTDDFAEFVGDAGYCILYNGLDTDTAFLPLPAVISSTVVLNANCDATGQDGSESRSCCACCR